MQDLTPPCQVIDRAQQGDDAGIHELLDALSRPDHDSPGGERFAQRPPDWVRTCAGCSMLSCSSWGCGADARRRNGADPRCAYIRRG